MEGVVEKGKEEASVEVEEVEAPPAELRMSLILESKLRAFLSREKLANKKGKSRKLNKADKLVIEEEVSLFAFSPGRFAQQIIEKNMVQQMELRNLDRIPAPEAQAEAKAEAALETIATVVAESGIKFE